jgi:hypothetical protein
MATKNLARTIVEGGRDTYSKLYRRLRNRSERRLRFDLEGDPMHGQQRLGGSRGFADRLMPLEILHSPASLDDPVQDALSDHVRLLPSARGVRRHVNPDLENVACGHAFRPHQATEDGLQCRRLPDNDVRGLAGGADSEVLPCCKVRRLEALDVDVWRHTADEPESQRVSSSEECKACSPAAQHPAEMVLPVARQQEAHRHFSWRALRKRLPTGEEVLAPHES